MTANDFALDSKTSRIVTVAAFAAAALIFAPVLLAFIGPFIG